MLELGSFCTLLPNSRKRGNAQQSTLKPKAAAWCNQFSWSHSDPTLFETQTQIDVDTGSVVFLPVPHSPLPIQINKPIISAPSCNAAAQTEQVHQTTMWSLKKAIIYLAVRTSTWRQIKLRLACIYTKSVTLHSECHGRIHFWWKWQTDRFVAGGKNKTDSFAEPRRPRIISLLVQCALCLNYHVRDNHNISSNSSGNSLGEIVVVVKQEPKDLPWIRQATQIQFDRSF